MKYVRLVNMVLSIALAVTFVSGILLQIFKEVPAFLILHKLSAVLLLVAGILHVIQNKKGRSRNEK